MTAIEYLKAKPIAGSVVVGLLASLCCGGSLIFTSIGLGVFYSTLGLSRFVPEALAAGALVRVAVFGVTTVLFVGVLLDASSKVSGTVSGQHGSAH